MKIQSEGSTWELKNMLENYGFEYRHVDLLYVGSLGIDFINKTFFQMAITIYPKKTNDEILEMLKDNA